MKFRCERDTLAEAIGTAQRAVAVRSGALPVLSGVQVTAPRTTRSSSSAPTSISPSGCRIPAQVDNPGEAVVPAKLFDGLTTRLEGRVRSPSRSRATTPGSPRARPGPASGCCRPTSSRACSEPEGTAVTVDAGPFARGAAPGDPRGVA